MRDQTPGRIDALITDETAVYPLDGGTSAEIAVMRAAIEATGELRAGAVAAEIANLRGLLLLWDVLVGITIGTLAHDQDAWTRRTGLAPNCGTLRCVAGWLAQFGHPGSTPAFGRNDLHTAQQRLADGTTWAMGAAAVAALTAVPPREVYDNGRATEHIREMFSGGVDLAEVWAAATAATGGVVALPDTLVDRVADLDAERYL